MSRQGCRIAMECARGSAATERERDSVPGFCKDPELFQTVEGEWLRVRKREREKVCVCVCGVV